MIGDISHDKRTCTCINKHACCRNAHINDNHVAVWNVQARIQVCIRWRSAVITMTRKVSKNRHGRWVSCWYREQQPGDRADTHLITEACLISKILALDSTPHISSNKNPNLRQLFSPTHLLSLLTAFPQNLILLSLPTSSLSLPPLFSYLLPPSLPLSLSPALTYIFLLIPSPSSPSLPLTPSHIFIFLFPSLLCPISHSPPISLPFLSPMTGKADTFVNADAEALVVQQALISWIFDDSPHAIIGLLGSCERSEQTGYGVSQLLHWARVHYSVTRLWRLAHP